MPQFFEGFDLGDVERITVRSYVVGPGQSAELVEVTLEVWRTGGDEPEVRREVFGEGRGMALAVLQAVLATLNRRLAERRGEAG